MNKHARNLKQAAQRANIPLRQYAHDAAEDSDHPHHNNAITWLKNKIEGEREQIANRQEKRSKNQNHRIAHPPKKGGKKEAMKKNEKKNKNSKPTLGISP